MRLIRPENRNRILLRDYHNYSFCRTSKVLWRNRFGDGIPVNKGGSECFIIKKNGKRYKFTEDELMRLTDYAGRCGLVSKEKVTYE